MFSGARALPPRWATSQGEGRSSRASRVPCARYRSARAELQHAPMRRQVEGEAVRRELLPGTSTELLKELHLLTRAVDLNADSLRKLKQVNHLAGLLAPAARRRARPVRRRRWSSTAARARAISASSSTSSFLGPAGKGGAPRGRGAPGPRPRGRGARGAARLRSRSASSTAPIAGAPRARARPRRDRAARLRHRDRRRARARDPARRRPRRGRAVLPGGGGAPARGRATAPSPRLAPLFDHPLAPPRVRVAPHERGARLALEAAGYKVTVTELTGWEHSVKNELILGKKVRGALARGEGAARRAPRRRGGAPEARPAPRRRDRVIASGLIPAML